MDLRQLRYFVHVATFGSFSGAATQLNVAQSAISRHVRVLEEELGVTLLERHGRGAQPTAAGEVLLKRATRLLRSVDEMREAVVHAGLGPSGQVSLAIPPSVSATLAASALESCRREYPHITLQLSESWTGDILDWLLMGHNDLGVIYSSQVDERIMFRPIVTENLCLVGAAFDPALRNRNAITLAEVAALPLIAPPEPHGLRKVIGTAFSEQSLVPRIAYESQVWSVIREMIRSGLAYGILAPNEVGADIRRGHIVSVPIVEPELKRTLGVAIRRGNAVPPSVEAVLNLISREAPDWYAAAQSVS